MQTGTTSWLGAVTLLLSACAGGAPEAGSGAAGSTNTPAAAVDTARPTRVYFGDTHVHTGWSADAGLDGAITGPEDAFRLARGDSVKSNTGRMVKLSRPFDWMVITDHSDGMGTINEIAAGNPEMVADSVVKRWSEALKSGDEDRMNAAKVDVITRQSQKRLPATMVDPKWMVSAWEKTIAIADKYNEPGRFTAMIGYEWTVNAGGGDNLHRNVIYRDDAAHARQMLPLTTFQTEDPEGLWKWMAEYEARTGGKLLAIPHNGNLSNGRMFEETRFDGSPLTREYAESRANWEPLFEITQMKGQSEAHPSLSPTDEFSRQDLWDRGNLIGVPKKPGMYRTEYWREALKSGLRLETSLGVNPFKYGANAATDTHTGLPTSDEDNFWGKFKTVEPSAERWNVVLIKPMVGWTQGAAGKMGVWASANTRAAIWDAMKRKEVYGTSGSRMTVRFFGGFDFAAADGQTRDVAAVGYSKGVPMGGDLRTAPAGKSPTFLIAAMMDPASGNLDRIQIIKGWLDATGKTQEKIFDVAWGDAETRKPDAKGTLPAVGNTVDLKTATWQNSIGDPELSTVWTDPEFEPGLRAFYYARVIEIPTPRWTLYDVVRYKARMPRNVPMTFQERAYTSPIWYTP